jgi:integrase
MAIYRKGKNKWRVRIYINGKRKDWVVEGTKEEAKAFEARKRTEMEANDPSMKMRNVPTFLNFCVAHYRPHAEVHLKESTWAVRKYQMATLMAFFGEYKLTELSTSLIEKFKLVKTKNDRLKPSTINDLLKVLGAILSYAKDINYPVSCLKMIKLKERSRKKAHAWSIEELNRLYEATAEVSPDILPLVVCLANTGLRKGEAINLKCRDVDLEKRIIHIWPSEEWQPKDCEPRLVPINDALLPWLQTQNKSDIWMFPCPNTGKKYAYWPQKKFDRARKAARLTGGPHTLRHTYATQLVLQTRDLFLVAKILGHSHTYVTELYADLIQDHITRAQEALSFPCPITPSMLKARKNWGVVKTVPRTVPKGVHDVNENYATH